MPAGRKPFGTLNDQAFSLFTISNAGGASLTLSGIGATAVAMNMPSPSGGPSDVILGFDTSR